MKRQLSFVLGVGFTLATLGLLYAPAVQPANAQSDCGCSVYPPGPARDKCELECSTRRNFREIADRVENHFLLVDLIEKFQCHQATGNWETCWGIFRASPFPPPDPFYKELVQSLPDADRDRLFKNLVDTANERHERELKLLKELFAK